VLGHLGDHSGAVSAVRQTIRSLERLQLVRYQLMAYEMLASLLLELDLNEQALEASQRGLALAKSAGIPFWQGRAEATHAIARMRLGDLEVGPALTSTLSWTRENRERTKMIRCLEGLAELALRRGEPEICRALADEMLALAEGGAMRDLSARALFWRGEALAALGKRDEALKVLGRAASAAEKIGHVRVAKDATEALGRVSGDAAHRARASALAARIEASARECRTALSAE